MSCLTNAYAAPAGLIKAVTGYPKVAIDTNGKSRTAEKGGEVFENDRITTALDQTVTLELRENTELIIGPSSQLIVEHYSNGSPQRTTLELVYGLMRTWVRKKLGAEETFVVKSPSANMGVRGTKFVSDVNRLQTTVHTLEGRVVLASTARGLDDPSQSVLVSQGQTSSIQSTATMPEPARSFDLIEFQNDLKLRAPQFERVINGAKFDESEPMKFPNGLEKPKKK